ncbi:MAG: 6-hydroxymethylpterin diphosphokinase MptE-like protein [Nitrososphaeraceae archaeon]
MKFEDWFPHYQLIRKKFGYSTEKDQDAAKLLSKLIFKPLNLKLLKKKIHNKRVLVIGAGPDLETNLDFIKEHSKLLKIAADGSVQFLLENNLYPDVVVTDLDGNINYLKLASKRGSIMVIHAHSDNVELLKKHVPKFSNIIGTTQVMPVENVYNFGGFTDGDRCVFLADEFGAKDIILVGMCFGNIIGSYSKSKLNNPLLKKEKMKIGKQLLYMLSKQSKSNLFDTAEKPLPGFTPFK